MKYYKSNRIYTPNGEIAGFIGVENGKIASISTTIDCNDFVDFGNSRIIPGIIDTHNHGACGKTYQDCKNNDDVQFVLNGEASFGVTGVFPTINKLEHIPALRDAANSSLTGSKILGIHSEGPFGTRVGEKGDPKNTYYMPCDLEYVKKMVEASQGWLKLFAIAPEKEGALEIIRYLKTIGITTSAYHTNANYQEAMAGIDAGISVATHLGNVMTGLHHRDVGTFGACLLRDEVTCELICDGLHVSLPMVQIVLKCKDHDKIMMVSDNGAYLGAPSGHYKGTAANANNDRREITVTPEGYVLSMTGRLSGSSKPVLYGISNLVEKLGMNMSEVINLFSYNPARKYNLENRGSLTVGNYADFVVISDNYEALNTFVEGREVWNSQTMQRQFSQEFLDKFRIGD